MSRAHRWAALALLALLGCARGAGSARADGPDPFEWDHAALGRAAQAWVDAFRAGDESALLRLASAVEPDPVLVTSSILSSHARGALAQPPEPKDFLAAAQAFSERTRGNPSAKGVAGMVAEWGKSDPAVLERERRVRKAYEQVKAERARPGGAAKALALARAAHADADALRSSNRGVYLAIEEAGLLLDQGDLEQGEVAAKRVLALAERLTWPRAVARGWRILGAIAERRGDLDGRIVALTRMAQAYREVGALASLLRAEGGLAVSLREAARYPEAIQAILEAHALAEKAEQPALVASAQVTEASIRAALGDDAAALRLTEEAAAAFERLGLPADAAAALSNQGNLHIRGDRLAQALRTYERALVLAETSRDPSSIALVLTSLGSTWRRLRQLEKALAVEERAAAEARRANDATLLGLTLGNLGIVQSDIGRPEWRATLEEALVWKRRAGDRRGAGETMLNIAVNWMRDGAHEAEARPLIAAACREFEALRLPDRVAVCDVALGKLELRKGDGAAAQMAYARALVRLEAVSSWPSWIATARDGLARALLLQGLAAEALAEAQQAVLLRRDLAVGLGEEDAALLVEDARTTGDVGLEAALALSRVPATAAQAGRAAFEMLEAGRSVLLAAGLVNAEALLAAAVPAPMLAAEASSRARLAAARGLVLASAAGGPGAPSPIGARAALDSASKAHGEAVARIQRESRRAAGIVWPAPAALAAVQAKLGADVAFVGYVLTAARAAAVVVTKDGARLVDLGEAAPLAARVQAYVRLVPAAEADDSAAAATLYEALVRPLEPALGSRTRLLLAPDGGLAFLSFAALLRIEGARQERLLERYEVTYVPSATTYLALLQDAEGRKPGRGFLGLGDPAPGGVASERFALPLEALPHTGEEVRAVAALYPSGARRVLLQREATTEALRAALPAAPGRLAALHLACHAFVDPEHPRLSSLVLAGGDVLDVDAIHRLRIPADLAVLSACATGRGLLLRGEGVMGFVRGFFYAGVPRVLVSDWVVEDASTAALMTAFHAALVRDGLAPSAALRKAQRAALAAGGAGAHPSRWAPFVLWGLPGG